MTVTCKFAYKTHVRHTLNEFEGFVIGVSVRPTHVEYLILPLTDVNADWREPVWIDEAFLEEIGVAPRMK